MPHPSIPTHAHCEFCWQTFADYGEPPDVLAEGYATAGNTDGFDEDFFREFPRDDYYWICEQCYEQYRDLFQWVVE